MQKGFFHPPPPLPTDDTWGFYPGNSDELKSSLHVLSAVFSPHLTPSPGGEGTDSVSLQMWV